MKLSPSVLLNIHAKIQMGTYFSTIKVLDDNIKFCYSNLIDDIYWNYAYDIKIDSKFPTYLSNIKKFASSINRQCVLYMTSDCNYPKSLTEMVSAGEIEQEAWMIFQKKNNTEVILDNSLEIEVFLNEQPNVSFIKVFDNAYGGGSTDSAGYYGLPSVYIDSIKNSKPKVGVSSVHFIGRKNGTAVAIASIFITESYAGLYNVGTLHEARRNNYGSEISKFAVKFAFKQKCDVVFLQTQVDSEVEKMYTKIGFKRNFIGKFIKL